MNNTLWVKFKGDNNIYHFYVQTGNKLSDVIKEIEESTGKTIEKASYNRSEVD